MENILSIFKDIDREHNSQFKPIKTNSLLTAILACVYFLVGKFGLSFATIHASASPIWPPAGIALTALLVFGYRAWGGIFIGAFLVNLTTAGTVLTSVAIATGNTLEGVLGAYLINRFANGRNVFGRSKDVIKFTILAALISTSVSATIGVTTLSIAGYAQWRDFVPICLTWWLGDGSGELIVVPLLLQWMKREQMHWDKAKIMEAIFFGILLLATGLLVFGHLNYPLLNNYPIVFICAPILVVIAFRFGPRETATATAILSAISVWGTVSGLSSFVVSTRNASLLLLETFMGVNAVMALMVAAVVSERKDVMVALRKAYSDLDLRVHERTAALSKAIGELQFEMNERKRAEEKFRDLLESAPDAMVITDAGGIINLVNSQTETMFGYTRKELLGQRIEILLPHRFRNNHGGYRVKYSAEPRLRPMGAGLELFGLRKDNTEFPVEISLSPISTSEGDLFTAAIRDITERKRIEAQAKEAFRKEVLLKEIHHRVKNNLQVVASMLNLQSEYLTDERLLGILADSQNRIKAISLIHEKLYQSQDLGKVEMGPYFESLGVNLLRTHLMHPSSVSIKVNAEGIYLGIDTAIPCGLVINELISNCLKHAFPNGREGEIYIQLFSANNGDFILQVQDNGIGFPKEIDFRNTRSLGLQLVIMFIQQFNGTIELDSQNGTKYTINFKEKMYADRA